MKVRFKRNGFTTCLIYKRQGDKILIENSKGKRYEIKENIKGTFDLTKVQE